MIKLLKPFLVLVFVSLVSLAIGSQEDTILSSLGKATDSEKYDIFRNLSQLFYSHDKNTALKYSIKMLETATKMNDPALTAYSYYYIGLLNYSLDNRETSLSMLQNAYDYYLSIGSDTTLGNIFNIMSRLYLTGQMYQKSVEAGTKAMFYYSKARHNLGIGFCYSNFGNMFERLKDYPKAIQLYKLSEQYLKKQNNISEINILQRYLASCYIDSDSIPKGKKILDNLIFSHKQAGNKTELMKDYGLLGNYYLRINKNDSAVYFYNESANLASLLNDWNFRGTTLTKIGHVYSLEKNWKKTLEFNQLALEEREKIGIKNHISSSYLNLAGNYIELKEYKTAEEYIRKGLQFAIESNSRILIQLSYQKFSQLYSVMGNYTLAYQYLQQNVSLNDSILRENEKKISLTLFNDYEREQQRLTLQEQKKSSQDLFNTVSYILIIGFLIIIITLIFYRYKEKRKIFVHATNENLAIKEQQQAIQKTMNQLKISEEKYRLVSEAAAAGIGIVDENENFIYVNNALCQLLGYSEKEMLQKNLDSFSQQNEFEKFKNLTITRKSGLTNNYETQLLCKNNSFVDVHVWASPLYDENGKFYATLGIIMDLTENKKITHELSQAKQKAEESEKLKSSFLANMSHEVRTPINAIVGGLYLLQNEHFNTNDRENLQNQIIRNANNLLELWDNIITVARLHSDQIEIQKTWISVNLLITKLIDSWKTKIPEEKSGTLSIKLCEDVSKNTSLSLFCDEKYLTQIFNSLISNAIKFSESGVINICYQIDSNKNIIFTIKDTGIGIQKDEMTFIFEQFRQAREGMSRKFGGAGLGLTIAKGLVELMGGKIWVENNPDKGSTFSFSLPDAVNNDNNQGVKNQLNIEYPNWSGKTILLVEDVETNFQFLEALLKKTKARTFWCHDGREAVEFCKNNTDIDLILMDLQMPVMNGLEATIEIRKFNQEIIIIAQTAYAMIHDKQKTIEAGCNDFVIKPIRIKNLNEVLTRYLGPGS